MPCLNSRILIFELPLCKQNVCLWRLISFFCRVHARFVVKSHISYLEIVTQAANTKPWIADFDKISHECRFRKKNIRPVFFLHRQWSMLKRWKTTLRVGGEKHILLNISEIIVINFFFKRYVKKKKKKWFLTYFLT